MEKNIIPDAPTNLEKVEDTVQSNFDGWIKYLQNLSPRISLRLATDEKFDIKKYENLAKLHIVRGDKSSVDSICIVDWPNIDQIVFLVTIDSSMPGQSKSFLLNDTYIYCYGGVAFGLTYFESIEDEDADFDVNNRKYGLDQYPESALTFEHITKRIKDKLIEIQSKIPPAP